MTDHDDTDIPHLQYHEWCRANLPEGWVLHGSTLDAGCRAMNATTYNDFPHAALAEIARMHEEMRAFQTANQQVVNRLEARITALETAARAVVALVYGNAYEKIHYCDEVRWGIVHDGIQSLIDLKKILDVDTCQGKQPG